MNSGHTNRLAHDKTGKRTISYNNITATIFYSTRGLFFQFKVVKVLFCCRHCGWEIFSREKDLLYQVKGEKREIESGNRNVK